MHNGSLILIVASWRLFFFLLANDVARSYHARQIVVFLERSNVSAFR